MAVADLVKRLRAQVAGHPDDAESWYLLGHALLRSDDAPAAVTAFESLVALVPDDPGAEVALAQARYIADGGVITAANRTLIERILAGDPNQSIVNEMLALAAFQNSDYATAAQHLERALAGGATGARAQSLQTGLARARAALGDAGPALAVTVDLGADAGTLPANAALFVFARKPGERMPLLVARRGVQGNPVTVRLDKANGMQGAVQLNSGDVLEVGARLSRSGELVADATDPQAIAADVRLSEAVVAVQLALAPQGAAVARVSAPDTAPSAGPGAVPRPAIPIAVRFAPGLVAAAPARVFVIARAPDGPPMPIAVRALEPAALPLTVTLTDADAMQATRNLDGFAEVEIVARLSRSGSPMRGPGDVESAARRIDPHSSAPIELIIGAP
jgi:cytochrome c-type biogenesis protein CcmH